MCVYTYRTMAHCQQQPRSTGWPIQQSRSLLLPTVPSPPPTTPPRPWKKGKRKKKKRRSHSPAQKALGCIQGKRRKRLAQGVPCQLPNGAGNAVWVCSYIHTRLCVYTNTPTHAHPRIHTRPHTKTHTHTHSLTHSRSLSLTHTHALR